MLTEPQNGGRKLNYGVALFAIGDYDYAAYAIRRGLDRVAEWGGDAMDPKILYGEQGGFDRHLGALRDYASGHKDDNAAHFVLGYMLWASGQYKDARPVLDDALKIDPDDGHIKKLHDLATNVDK